MTSNRIRNSVLELPGESAGFSVNIWPVGGDCFMFTFLKLHALD
jgi:hypothetical protein